MNDSINEYSKKKEKLKFFDINLWWDPSLKTCLRKHPDFGSFYKSFEDFSIESGVLTLAECIKYDNKSGNRHLKEILANYKNIFGAMVLTDDTLFSGEDIRKTVDEMVETRLVIVRMFPRTLSHPFNKNSLNELFKHLNRRRIPLMLWHAEVSWDTIASLLSEYPDMPVIAEGNDVKLLYHNRFYVPLYIRFKNFYLETHNLVIYKELDFLAGIDPNRLLFGSYYQYNAPDTAMAPIILADWDYYTKELISHGNLERLISEIR